MFKVMFVYKLYELLVLVLKVRIAAVDSILGAFAVDEDGNVVIKAYGPTNINDIVDRILNVENGKPSEEFYNVVKKIVQDYGSEVEVIVEDENHARVVLGLNAKAVIEPENRAVLKLKEMLPSLAVEGGFIKSSELWVEFVNNVMLQATRVKLRGFATKRDLLAIQVIRAIDDIDKTVNLFASRIREWYSVHFPELDDLVADHRTYAKIVYEVGRREDLTVEKLKKLGLSEGKAQKIVTVAGKSMGADLSDTDIARVREFVKIILDMYDLRDLLTEYLSQVMKEVAPNITELVGPLLGARLLSLAGSLEDLAKMPASTIQVLGAEKALFRALRTGGKPPKHGVIFQYPEIHTAPRWQRGKIARALATKLAIAAKADYFTGRFIADKLLKELKDRITEIKTLYEKPPVKAKVAEKPTELKRHEGKKEKPWRKGKK